MKNSILTLGLAASVLVASCGDRKTEDNGEIELEAQNQQVTPEDMFQTSGEDGLPHSSGKDESSAKTSQSRSEGTGKACLGHGLGLWSIFRDLLEISVTVSAG